MVRAPDGKFEKGKSGNPKGRPKGSKNAITLLRQSLELQLREQAAPDMSGVLQKAVELALEGDRSMIKLLMEMHMSKSTSDDKEAKEKVEITITGAKPEVQKVSLIDVTPTQEDE